MTRPARVLSLAVVASVALAAACRPKAEPATPPTPTVNQDSIDAARRAEEARLAAEARRADSIRLAEAARREEEARRAAAIEAARRAVTAPIYFDYDRAELSTEAQATLDAKIPVLNANPNLTIRVVGNTDERGSDEYNLALGQRRAAAAKRYLVQRGIAENRIEIVSQGEESPVCQLSEESCWSQNRRDEFVILAGGESLVAAQ